MVSLSCTATAFEGGSLVSAVVTGDGVPRRVTLVNRLDGPVWPPRRRGVPVAGWDERGFTGRVPADGRLAVGYASPAPPTDEPLELAAVETAPADGVGRDDAPSRSPHSAGAGFDADVVADADADIDSPTAVVRELGDPSPPRAAVPVASVDEADAAPGPDDGEASVPDSVAAWLDDAGERVRAAERLGDAETLSAATAALTDAGGLAAAADLSSSVETDAAALRAVARRADELADRAASAEVPIETFERLA